MLKKYIKMTYKQPLRDIKLEAAGQKVYKTAKGGTWDVTNTLIKDAKDFMTDNLLELTANNTMPAGFPDEFDVAATKFTKELSKYGGSVNTASSGTVAKDKAIREDVEDPLSDLFDLGRVSFFDEPQNLKKFTYVDLIKKVKGNHPARPERHGARRCDRQAIGRCRRQQWHGYGADRR